MAADRGRGRLVAGAGLVGLFAAATLLAPWLAPVDPTHVPASLAQAMLRPPGAGHLLGTDALGRDLLSRVLHGGRVSLAIGIGVEAVSAAIGIALGLLAGYYGGWRDGVLMRLTDVVMAFPSLILAIGLIAVFERPGLDKVAVVLVALGWTTIARVVRGEVLSVKEREYVQAARALGTPDPLLMLRHVLPNLAGPVIVTATIGVGSNMVAEAGLSFLGLGAQAPTLSWGSMLAEGQTFLASAPWVAVFPGLALMLAVLGINLLGDALRDRLDPRLRRG
ncbi:MAG: ABC transporter permease [Candidatus Rokubacteria bacterium]|nr:ABC transporter permease [Candidatus Rokubacteria bacterium]